ncbi:MAG: SDR family oxidoreductase [Pseudomonadales bacterium]|nr:SDR family oxidoreductase [Pseudomonadales bacterium]
MTTTQAGWPRVRFDFAGLDVLVTGGTKGIGKAIACAFRDAGARVTITGGAAHERDYDELPAGVRYRQLRLTERSDIEALATAVTALDVLVNNAGGTGGASSPYDFDTALTVNLGAVYHLSEALADVLSRSTLEGGASIVNLASEMALFASPYFAGYGAAKAGVVQLTRTFCAALAPRNIRVNAVLPGSIPTPMTNAFAEDPAVHAMVSNATPLARWGKPEEIAGAVLFLSSPVASFISGHTLVVDGGYSILK